MNAILRDKCFARRMVRAGCVEAVGIVRARRMDSTRAPTNAERVSAWRERSHAPGFGGYYVRPWKSKRKPEPKKPRIRVTVPQPLCQPAPDKRTTPPPGATAQAGSQHRPALPAHCELDQPKQRGAVSIKETP